MTPAKTTAFDWVNAMHPQWSDWNAHIWDLAETAWREYRSSQWYVKKLRAEGFDLARRTVAKYREAMGIGSSVQRRRSKKLAGMR